MNGAFSLLSDIYETRYSTMGHLWSGCLHFEPNRCPKTVSMTNVGRSNVTNKAIEIMKTFQPLEQVPNGIYIVETLLIDYVERLITFVAGIERSCMYLRCLGSRHAFRVVA